MLTGSSRQIMGGGTLTPESNHGRPVGRGREGEVAGGEGGDRMKTHLKRLKRLEIPVFASRTGRGHMKNGSEGPYFQGNFQKLKTSKGVKFPKDVPKPFCLRQIVSDEKKE